VIRFAFYGRTVATNRRSEIAKARQLQIAQALIGPLDGQIVAEFFDTSTPGSRCWHQREQAEALLTAISKPGRAFDAVVIAEAGAVGLLRDHWLLAIFNRYGLRVWLPELAGPFDEGNRDHRTLLAVLDGAGAGDNERIRARVRASMNRLRLEGRMVGGPHPATRASDPDPLREGEPR
jgi:hypothetical protein